MSEMSLVMAEQLVLVRLFVAKANFM